MIVPETHLKWDRVRPLIYGIIWVCLLSTYPYVFNMILPIPRIAIMSSILCLILYCLVGQSGEKLKRLNHSFNTVVTLQIIGWLIFIILHRDVLYVERIIYISIVYFFILCLYNCRGGIFRFMEQYDKFITFMAIAGTICFFLVFLFQIPALFSFSNKDGREALFYGLTSTNTIWGNIIRYAGYFDEPGAMAYWGIWALIFNKLFFENKKIEKYLLICLTFTLSMAYYIQVVFYILFFKLKSLKQVLVVSLIVIVLGGAFYYTAQNVPALYTLTFSRFELRDDGQLRGDNRSELAEKAKTQFLSAPMTGKGISNMSDLEYMSDNPYETLAYDGVIGTIITYLPFIFLWAKGSRKIRFAIIILGLGFLQRPFHHYILYYFMTYNFLLLTINFNNNENTRI